MEKRERGASEGFQHLNPVGILNLVEEELGFYCSNLCRPLNSYINRVYEFEDEDGNGYVIKFYRPGRWSEAALREEHTFMAELAEAEIPVIAPLPLTSGTTLGCRDQVYFAIYPKKGGRYLDELGDEQWLALGRLLGRAHLVGAGHDFSHRPVIRPDKSTAGQLHYILESGLLPPELLPAYQGVVEQFIEQAAPLFSQSEMIRIHGDCHAGNLIYRPDEAYYLIDLDDMAMGPPIQDFWMLLPGAVSDSWAELDFFLEGYETFRSFDHGSLALMEPLRAMRFVHYSAWCAYQVKEDGSSPLIPDFGSHGYWQQEIDDLADQLERMKEGVSMPGNSW
ncbi:serine/threonine protein kinase [Desulfogranum mediterraneum]|uniref:serine/threonine protein kinase n=1 Tax=Desulfogranum mediterraneum TaxID=160661 RepID=UPI000411616D|nr:serine/threonine protein kinase [Desulfogranum mediterraneum]